MMTEPLSRAQFKETLGLLVHPDTDYAHAQQFWQQLIDTDAALRAQLAEAAKADTQRLMMIENATNTIMELRAQLAQAERRADENHANREQWYHKALELQQQLTEAQARIQELELYYNSQNWSTK
jgi:chromosome segregation ATPase